MTHTLLAVPVPEAEILVRGLIARWEPTYDIGDEDDLLAHVTVLSPFVDPAAIDEDLLGDLAVHFGTEHCFRYRLTEVQAFSDNVVYLAPDVPDRFRDFTASVSRRFPGHVPYGGKYERHVPHMTLGPIRSGEMERALREAGAKVVPLPCRATEVRLIVNDHRSFRTIARFPLGPDALGDHQLERP